MAIIAELNETIGFAHDLSQRSGFCAGAGQALGVLATRIRVSSHWPSIAIRISRYCRHSSDFPGVLCALLYSIFLKLGRVSGG
jgi:hypothetical protein